ncbi:MAG TPA: hypothetical protein VHV57_06240 [Acidimicrobiales bacterium]|nr:hypothetical protein [Acidimicrobiales bacterium]
MVASLKNTQRQLKIRLRSRVRRSMDRLDNEQVRRARGLLRALRTDPPDVLYLGDSMLSFVAAEDQDRRRLDTMVRDGLGAGTKMHVVDGASFHADLFDAYLRLLEATPHRPLVIVPLWTRGRSAAFMEHPVHGHKKAMRSIRQVNLAAGTWRVRGAWPRPTPAEFETFYAVPYPTLLGDLTVGDYVKPIAELARTGQEEERVKMLYAYHHGGLLTVDTPGMDAVTNMAKRIADLGCPVVVYQTPVPVETGVRFYGEQFAERTAASLRALNAAYRLGAGPDAEIIESGMSFAESEFIDPNDASEHLNERGRRRLADMIVQGVRARRGDAE